MTPNKSNAYSQLNNKDLREIDELPDGYATNSRDKAAVVAKEEQAELPEAAEAIELSLHQVHVVKEFQAEFMAKLKEADAQRAEELKNTHTEVRAGSHEPTFFQGTNAVNESTALLIGGLAVAAYYKNKRGKNTEENMKLESTAGELSDSEKAELEHGTNEPEP